MRPRSPGTQSAYVPCDRASPPGPGTSPCRRPGRAPGSGARTTPGGVRRSRSPAPESRRGRQPLGGDGPQARRPPASVPSRGGPSPRGGGPDRTRTAPDRGRAAAPCPVSAGPFQPRLEDEDLVGEAHQIPLLGQDLPILHEAQSLRDGLLVLREESLVDDRPYVQEDGAEPCRDEQHPVAKRLRP